MSVFKQISLLVSGSFLLLFFLVTIDNSQQSGTFLRGQLKTTAKDTATVLGMAISTTGSGRDIAALETMFNAVFDSGYYSNIRLLSVDKSIIHQKKRDLSVQGVPDWFIRAIPLDIAIGESNVMDGWTKLGTLEVTLHPGYAYTNLYKGLKTTVQWFSVLFLCVLCMLWVLLHKVLKPLKSIHQQALAIQDNEFILQPTIPKTRELRGVVQAMNRLVTKVRGVFEDQQEALRINHELLYCDELTGIKNRRYILSELDKVISESTPYHGCMILIKVMGLDRIREQEGYDVAESVIISLSAIITEVVRDETKNKYARMSNQEFALLVRVRSSVANDITSTIFTKFKQYLSDKNYETHMGLNAAITDVHDGYSHSKILSSLDLGLAQAQADGLFRQRLTVAENLILPEGKMQWRAWFRKMLDDHHFYLAIQPVFDLNQKCIHREVFVRANDDEGKLVPAGVFMPMAVALGYGLEIDCAVFSLVKKIGIDNSDDVPIALNLSTAFFLHSDAFEQLIDLLNHYKKNNASLCVEANHAALNQYPDRCKEVFSAVKKSGQLFGVDQLDLNLPLEIFQTINPSYIKISAKVLDDISSDHASGAYRALRSLTATLEIQLIAVGIDNRDLYQRLLALHIDGVQGNLIGEPEVIV